MFNISEEMRRLLEKYPDPRLGEYGRIKFRERQEVDSGRPRYGKVSDNRDPECLGRVRVACDLIAPGAVTPWIPIIAIGAGDGYGWWQIPDIGTQVLLGFMGKGHSNPIVIGCVYDEKNRPPKHSTARPADSLVYQTKNHRIEFIDEEGKEGIIISTAKGKIRLSLKKEKGIELINELGDIKLKSRKFSMKGGNINIEGRKKVTIKCGGKMTSRAKSMKLEGNGEVKFNANNIKFKYSRGLTTEGKQLAAQGDKVMGFDIHQMVVPAGAGTAIVPLPHPFIGKLVDKLSNNVKLKGYNAATMGSIAEHDNPVHNQLPGTIRFNQNPNRKGEVTGGTGKKVKINGKEVALIGSSVTTCNDIGARNNSTVIAPGASFPMPMIIHPKNTKAWKEEQDKQNKRTPEITNVRLSKTRCKEGEKVVIEALVKDIADGNMLKFQLFKEGQDPNVHIPFWQKAAEVEGGMARVMFDYTHPNNEEVPEEDPGIFAVAYSAWCPPAESDVLIVELKRPAITKSKCLDIEDSDMKNGFTGQPIKLYVELNEYVKEGAPVIFCIYKKGANIKYDKPVEKLHGINEGGKAEVVWKAKDIRETGDKKELDYFFTADTPRAAQVQSDNFEVKNPQIIEMKWEPEIFYHDDDEEKELFLHITTFEVACFSPKAKIQLWAKGIEEPEICIYEQEVTMDKDTLDIKFDASAFPIEDIYIEENEAEYKVEPRVICETLEIKSYEGAFLIIGASAGDE